MTRNKKILLVDDEASIIKALQRELHDWAAEKKVGFLSAASASEALKALEAENGSVALIVSDLRMPGQKGSDLLLEAKELYPDIPAILLTGFSETKEMMRVIKAGAFSYILKPWDHEYLLSEIEKALQVYELRMENKRYLAMLNSQIAWVGELQKAMFRLSVPPSEAVSFSALYHPVETLRCGGDYYDVVYLGRDRYAVLIGDVSGHGLGAALIAAILKSVIFNEYIRLFIGRDFSPADFLRWLARRMWPILQPTGGMIFTFCAGLLDARKRKFVFSNAGHEPVFHLRRNDWTVHSVPGTGIGYMENLVFLEKEIDLAPGDMLILSTDGLREKEGERERFPDDVLGNFFFDACLQSRGCDSILEKAKERFGVKKFADDVTILSVAVET